MTVKIYTTTHCPWCMKAKEYFRAKGTKFQEINVEEDRAKAEEMIRKSGQTGVPVIEINGKIIIGFDRHAIDEALGE